MTNSDDRLYAAVAMAKAGQKDQAREIVADILKADRNNANAWLVMAQVVDDRREVIQCLKQVLRIDPTNARAAAYLKRLDPSVSAAARSASAKAARARQAKPRRSPLLAILTGVVVIALIGGAAFAAAASGVFDGSGGALLGMPTPITPLAALPITPTVQRDAAAILADMTATAVSIGTATPSSTPTFTPTPSDTPTPTQTMTPRPTATIRPTRTALPTNTPAPTSISATSTPSLAPSVTLPAAGIGATQVVNGMNVTYVTEYYEFEAETADEIRAALQTMGPDVTDGDHAIASTEYRFRVSWREVQQGATCSLDAPAIQLDIIYTYPQWIQVGAVNQVLLDQWDAFIAHVTEHEEHHAELAIECGRDLLTAMNTIAPANSCVSLNTTINQIYDTEVQQCSDLQEAFDDAEGFTTFPLR